MYFILPCDNWSSFHHSHHKFVFCILKLQTRIDYLNYMDLSENDLDKECNRMFMHAQAYDLH